jgi:hypothetical protein
MAVIGELVKSAAIYKPENFQDLESDDLQEVVEEEEEEAFEYIDE